MRQLLYLLLIGFCITISSCRDDFEFETSNGGLQFSKDTVYLDTVFSNIGSSTYTLKVYNRSNKDISIPSIKLGQGQNSKYRLMVDGIPGKEFNNVELLAKDSMFVFIETTIDYSEYANNSATFLYTDNIQFSSTTGTQQVELVTLVQDAYFLYPQRDDEGQYENVPYNDTLNVYGFNLNRAEHDNELHWNNTKPYVVYGYATVPRGETLTVDPGARVHFHADSGLMVRPGAKLVVNGGQSATDALENEVIFEGDRLEPDFADIPGQWGAILLMSSEDNTINHLTLKNANIGIYARSVDDIAVPKLSITNSQIYYCSNFGLLACGANIKGENLVANNAGQAAVALIKGGTYDFKYSTFANYFNSYDQVPLLINNYQIIGNTRYPGNVNANFDNCIMYGSGNIGISMEQFDFSQIGNYPFHIRYNNSLIKFIDYSNQFRSNKLYPASGNDATLVEYTAGCKLATSSTLNKPAFKDTRTNKLQLITADNGTGPEGTADGSVITLFTTDITGTTRNSSNPDMGAYESVPEED
ncbi:hypothetical protein [Flavobacterium psychrotrophum]|uniref:hypothetical protein n=1 Tax=Flavobacterium psychrotrophum TaxID=2294119 RepID=UPI000E31C36D|nr:hypothetical protein [Flavobacterium psychrotrophum]